MRNFLLCLLVLALDAAFALSGLKTVFVPAFAQVWAGVPVSVWAGIAGIVGLVLLTFAVSLLTFSKREAAR